MSTKTKSGMWRRVATTLALSLPLATAQAADWPKAQPITIAVGYTAGGAADMLTRLLARKLEALSGQTVIVENKPGASGVLALRHVAKAKPDGYTLAYMTGPVILESGAPVMGRDLLAASMIANGPLLLVGPASNPANNLRELVPLMRKDPLGYSYATSGKGSTQHLAGALLATKLQLPLQDIPYRGGAQAVIDVVSGVAPLAVLGVLPVQTYIKDGKLKAFGITTRTRFAGLPDVETFEEQGVEGYDAGSWSAIGVPPGMAKADIEKLHAWIGQITASEEWKAALSSVGQVQPEPMTQQEVKEYISESQKAWNALATTAGFGSQ
ncbi:Bug family tripartite tricarboxylate transporter substrate binding protein [Bordetella genomosp. 12]|uniref:ABC transporter substrate-binding protein n=1 Tax=Bordetella genomosp. 12 TaxID=463035 RepID=A0A261VBS1_9BORD|nr:tripartite tricarboxylate transporter substrate binding protein [Bordetella genomosp. 12]OZI71604.1 hypothetical protein CAL22_17505 [Bordetella genomosp. 12]